MKQHGTYRPSEPKAPARRRLGLPARTDKKLIIIGTYTEDEHNHAELSRTVTTMTSDSEYIRMFAPLVRFLGAALGPSTEVVLHDVSDLDHSVVAIANAELSGRRIGSPATSLMLRTLQHGKDSNTEFVAGLDAETSDGKHPLRSSTFFIRRDGRLVGMLCLNSDNTSLTELERVVQKLVRDHRPEVPAPAEPPEQLVTSIDGLCATAIATAVRANGVPVTHFTPEDRMDVVRALNNDGFFQFKGGVAHLAHNLHVSEPTVYRYLHAARREGQVA